VVLHLATSIVGFSHAAWSMRTIRILKVSYVVPALRESSQVEELRLILRALMLSIVPLLWSAIVFLLEIYAFAVYLMLNVADYLATESHSEEAAANLAKRFGNLGLTVSTLFEAVTGGRDWTEITELLDNVHWTNVVVIKVFIFFTMIAMMNIMTGIFVDQVVKHARGDRTAVIKSVLRERNSAIHTLKAVFDRAKQHGAATISIQDFADSLRDKHTRALLSAVGLDVHGAHDLFNLLDTNGSKEIDAEEFVHGFMRWKGSAKSTDIAFLKRKSDEMQDAILELQRELQRGDSDHTPRSPNGAKPTIHAHPEWHPSRTEVCRC